MLSKTVLLAIRALLVVANAPSATVISPRVIAGVLGESPAYMAKVVRLLVRAGILHAERGVRGGVLLSRRTRDITLLEIVEACQGTIHSNYCQPLENLQNACALHNASVELERAIVQVLSRWTVAHMERAPKPAGHMPGGMHCMLAGLPAAINARPELRPRRKGAR